MATGSEISAVFCAAEDKMAFLFSQYSRAAEVALFVGQYSVMSSSISSLVSKRSGSPLL